MKARKKPIVLECTQWFKMGDHPKVVPFTSSYERTGNCKHCGKTIEYHGWVKTLEGGHIVCPSDIIMTGTQGENWPVKENIFKETYEIVEE